MSTGQSVSAEFQEHAAANPARQVVDSVAECLSYAATWHAWDGRPIARVEDGKPNTWTPHKALRRIADHLLDHLQEVEALLAGAEPVPDEWHGRLVTVDADWRALPSWTSTRRSPGWSGSRGATCCGTAWPARPRGTRRGARHGRCARSPSRSAG